MTVSAIEVRRKLGLILQKCNALQVEILKLDSELAEIVRDEVEKEEEKEK